MLSNLEIHLIYIEMSALGFRCVFFGKYNDLLFFCILFVVAVTAIRGFFVLYDEALVMLYDLTIIDDPTILYYQF